MLLGRRRECELLDRLLLRAALFWVKSFSPKGVLSTRSVTSTLSRVAFE
jgi:hypothetical protein